jgi:hypothetical protein
VQAHQHEKWMTQQQQQSQKLQQERQQLQELQQQWLQVQTTQMQDFEFQTQQNDVGLGERKLKLHHEQERMDDQRIRIESQHHVICVF